MVTYILLVTADQSSDYQKFCEIANSILECDAAAELLQHNSRVPFLFTTFYNLDNPGKTNTVKYSSWCS
ncbi:unnamed protein product [Gongylonema pulchrum]|nr:unnamed protein product [Gongylonema pulchrum]